MLFAPVSVVFIDARRYILPQDATGQLDLRQFLAAKITART